MATTYSYVHEGRTKYVSFAPGVDHIFPEGAADITAMTDGDIAALETSRESEQAKAARRSEASSLLDAAARRQTANAAEFTDRELATLASLDVFDKWRAGAAYATGKRLMHGGRLYVVTAPVTAQAHQPPDAAGMLAVYRLVDAAAGTADDPKTLAVGMAVELGLHYRYNGVVYRLARAMDLTVVGYMPGDPGMETFWVEA